ncbi:MAG TPA: hypothetical protein VG672_27695, partial [Bryobacteraceae bacterium]|nr:hypothetical protein [Bryobacteraceae bacterium]
VLKKLGRLHGNEAVAPTGAVYQDWRGTREFPRAHRFPCNPKVAGRNLPEFAPTSKMEDALIEPLAITDFLTFEVNYADCRFEDLGGIAAGVEAVQYVLSHQPPNQAVNLEVIQHAVLNIALEGYQRAYVLAAEELVQRINQENVHQMLARSAKSKVRPVSPTLNLESIQDVVYDMRRFTNIVQPRRLLPEGIRQYAHRLESLAGVS